MAKIDGDLWRTSRVRSRQTSFKRYLGALMLQVRERRALAHETEDIGWASCTHPRDEPDCSR